MPRLNCSESTLVKLSSVELDLGRMILTLEMSQALHQECLQAIQQTVQQESRELALVLPQGWTLYWKLRDGDSRSLVAHPEKDEWVGTLALTSSCLRQFLNSLELLKSGSELTLSQFGELSHPSNLEVIWKLKT